MFEIEKLKLAAQHHVVYDENYAVSNGGAFYKEDVGGTPTGLRKVLGEMFEDDDPQGVNKAQEEAKKVRNLYRVPVRIGILDIGDPYSERFAYGEDSAIRQVIHGGNDGTHGSRREPLPTKFKGRMP